MNNLSSHQQEAISRLKKWRVGALFMECGTGKTRVALELVNAIEDSDFVLWIAPLHTINGDNSVTEEINKWGGFNKECAFFGIESLQSSDRIFFLIEDLVKSHHNVFIVVDESLKIKNIEAKRTQRVLYLGSLAKYRLILNGTPLSRNILDIWAQMQFLSPSILNMDYNQFKHTFCDFTVVTKYIGGRRFTKEFLNKYENIDYLYSLIRQYVYECDLQLNIKQDFHIINYKIDSYSKSEYYNLKREFLSDETLEFLNNNIFMAMTQKMQHSYCCSDNKFTAVRDLFDSGIPQEKSIIYCKYVDSRESCERLFPHAKVLSYQKEAFGLNLQDYHYTIFFDKIWDYALRVQATRRTFRIGQSERCQYYDLTGDVGLENMIDKNIDKKISMSEYFKKTSRETLLKEL